MLSVQEILKFSNIFAIKVAMEENIHSKDLDFLDAHEQGYVLSMGKAWHNPMNKPPFVADANIWKKAKKALKKYWKKYEEPYAVVMRVYSQMGGKIKKKNKKSKSK